MSQPFIQDFDDRKRQVRHYLAVVSRTEREAVSGSGRAAQGRLLTLRAGTFLILYNLIEASARGAMEAVHDHIVAVGPHFPLLHPRLREEVIRLFKKGADPTAHHSPPDFPSAFVSIAMAQGIKFSGNVDAKAIREIADQYGFSHITDEKTTRNGGDLLTIKTNRNDLAHGRKTFEQVGRDHTAPELLLMARRSMRYMEQILRNVATYIEGEHYLEFPPNVLEFKPISERSM